MKFFLFYSLKCNINNRKNFKVSTERIFRDDNEKVLYSRDSVERARGCASHSKSDLSENMPAMYWRQLVELTCVCI